MDPGALTPVALLERLVPAVAPLPRDLAAAVDAEASVIERAAGSVVLEGGRCGGMLLLERGTLAITAAGGPGRSLLLHRAQPGEPCGLVFRCLDAAAPYAGACTAESDVRGLVLPPSLCELLGRDSPAFREFVLASAGQRLSTAFGAACAIAFEPLSARVATALCARADECDGVDLPLTHQRLADELGCTREAASRVLEHLAAAGAIVITRGAVRVLDRPLLARFAAPSA